MSMSVEKVCFLKFERVFKFYFELVNGIDEHYTQTSLKKWFQNMMSNSERRTKSPVRASRVKNRNKNIPAKRRKMNTDSLSEVVTNVETDQQVEGDENKSGVMDHGEDLEAKPVPLTVDVSNAIPVSLLPEFKNISTKSIMLSAAQNDVSEGKSTIETNGNPDNTSTVLAQEDNEFEEKNTVVGNNDADDEDEDDDVSEGGDSEGGTSDTVDETTMQNINKLLLMSANLAEKKR